MSLFKKKDKEKEEPTRPTGEPDGIPATATYVEVPKGSSLKEKGGDLAGNFRKTRINASSLTPSELIQLEKLRRVYEGVFGSGNIPIEFKTSQKNALGDGVVGSMLKGITGDLLTTNEGFKPDSEYFHTTNWYRGIDSANGKYRPEAKAMINIICTFQSNKSKGNGITYAGYPDDPENLFLEEYKTWVRDHFANFVEKDKENIRKRCGYLEDILCKEGLFDRPNSEDKFTVQKVVVEIRRILKSTIQQIDAAETHVDAGRSLDHIMNYVRLFMDEAASLLWYSFREKNQLEGQSDNADKSERLHAAVLSTNLMKQVLPHRSKLGGISSPKVLGFSENGKLELHPDYLPKGAAGAAGAVVSANKFVEVNSEEQLAKMFSGDESGFDRNFRDNFIVAGLYLESYAFLMDMANLYGVLKQAKGAAQTGGTMLLYGAANAHFNALLELTERLTDGLRTRLSKIVEIGESRFEQLVEINWATTSRCPWIGNYRELPRILVQVEKNAAEVFKTVGKARSEANALTLKERKEQAEEETVSFLNAAESLTKNAGRSMNIAYNSYKSLEASEKAAEKVDAVSKQLKARDEKEKKKEAEEEEKQAQEFLEKQMTETSASSEKKYFLVITTSKELGSGTDADVYIVLVGTKGKTVQIQLPDEDKTKFEQGNIDRFDVEVRGDIGEITQIKLGLFAGADKFGADWRVKQVEVVDKGASRKYFFDCKDSEVGGSGRKAKKEICFEPTRR